MDLMDFQEAQHCAPEPEPPPPPPVVHAASDDSEPPGHAMDLIRLLDWLALAEDSGTPPGVVKHLNREIGRILSRAGVVPVQETGPFNPLRQQVIDTRPSEDPSLEDTVSSTVRPGYVFGDSLLRPQEVILYSLSRP